jgi:steroid delta-isomerase-like uncharacterized protein
MSPSQFAEMDDTARLIREYFDTFNRRDNNGRLALLADDVRHDINEGPSEYGRADFARFIEHMDARYREQIIDLVVMTNEYRGAAEFIVEGEYIGTDQGLPEARGQRYSVPAAAFFEVQDGKITRVTSYYNLRGWIEAVSS